MKVTVEFLGLQSLTQRLGGKRHEIDLPGSTVQELIQAILQRYGQPARRALLDAQGELEMTIQVLHNGREWITHDRLDHELNDGDAVSFLLLVAGG